MHEEIKNATMIPFSFSEERAKDLFIDWLIDGDIVPVDVAWKAKIKKFRKQYYPVRQFVFTYSASWTAMSVYEHEEEYTEYTSKTVYIDYKGHEHNHSGTDYLDSTGKYTQYGSNSHAHPWRPISKTVPIKKRRTVIDKMERTAGKIGPFTDSACVAVCKENILEKYLEVTAEQDTVPTSDALLEGCAVMPLLKSTEQARDIADDKIYSLASAECKRDVPGNRYEDFSMNNYNREYSMGIVLIPVFEIAYEHNGTDYLCWLGGYGEPAFMAHTKPEDNCIAEADTLLNQQIQAKKDQKKKTYLHIAGYGAVSFLGLFIIPSSVQSFFFPLCSLFPRAVGLNIVTYLISILLGFVPAVICIPKIKGKLAEINEIKRRIEQATQKKNNYHSDLIAKKQRIAAIVKNKNMSWIAKDEAIKAILSQDCSSTTI